MYAFLGHFSRFWELRKEAHIFPSTGALLHYLPPRQYSTMDRQRCDVSGDPVPIHTASDAL